MIFFSVSKSFCSQLQGSLASFCTFLGSFGDPYRGFLFKPPFVPCLIIIYNTFICSIYNVFKVCNKFVLLSLLVVMCVPVQHVCFASLSTFSQTLQLCLHFCFITIVFFVVFISIKFSLSFFCSNTSSMSSFAHYNAFIYISCSNFISVHVCFVMNAPICMHVFLQCSLACVRVLAPLAYESTMNLCHNLKPSLQSFFTMEQCKVFSEWNKETSLWNHRTMKLLSYHSSFQVVSLVFLIRD